MDRETFYSSIEQLITESRNTYCHSPKRMVSDYNEENRITGDYNGRQILELLQNADDAESKEVEITFDKEQRQLVIANKGEPFSVGGIDSLMTANLSAKTRRQFIGNKGLGFRSILNWANSVRIRTNGCVVDFSAAIAAEEFRKLPIDNTVKETLLYERGLSLTTIPFPVLAIPKVEYDISPSEEWTTVIEIFYKPEFEQKISDQLKDCREEILIFLNNIDHLRINQVGENVREYKKTALQEADLNYVEINGNLWRTETMEDILPEHLQDLNKIEKEYYNITIAFRDDLSDEYYKLFNYFPTRLTVSLPCVIHATFDLNSSRDYLHESPKNEFIFQQLVQLLHQTALKLVKETDKNSDWRPLKLLLPLNSKTDSVLIGTFYQELEKLHQQLSIFPCVNGTYHKLQNIKYYGKAFSEWIVKNDYSAELPELLQPEENVIEEAFGVQPKAYSQKEFTLRIDSLSKTILDINKRATLISFLISDAFRNNRGERYSLLVNENNEVIDKSNVVFTPIIESAGTFYRPDFIKIDFINRELYRQLNNEHRVRYQSTEPESREFQRLFKDILNIQPYDSNNVLTRIITGTRDRIKGAEKEIAVNDVKATVQCLFENFKTLRYKEDVFTETCPLLNDYEEIIEGSELFLSHHYKSGVFNQRLYEGILTGENFLSDTKAYGIIDSDKDVIESFFIWLGVNKHVQFKQITINKEQWDRDPYFDYVFSKVKRPNPVSRFFFKGKGIGLIDNTLSKLSNERILTLIIKEDKMLQALEVHNTDKLTYQYSGSYPEISEKPSYISYQLAALRKFSGFSIDSIDLPFLNIGSVNYNDPIFLENGIRPGQVNEVLVKLGAHQSFSDFPTAEVYKFIQQCATAKATPKQARKLYLQAFDHFRGLQMQPKAIPADDLCLLAIKNGIREYRPSSEVYYSDNSALPSRITDGLWMFDFPKRLGENQVARFFKVNTVKNLELAVHASTIREHWEDQSLQEWFFQIKPFILAYRISYLKTKDDKREAANAIKSCSIQLVTHVEYSLNRNTKEVLGFEEFLIAGSNFIVCAEKHKNLEQLRTSPVFCSAFAEMMCILFKVNEAKNNYISIFKDNLDFTKELIKEDSLEDFLQEAYELLGLSNAESQLWEAICKIKDVQWKENVKDQSDLEKFLDVTLTYQLPPDYDQVDFQQFDNSSSFTFLKSLCEKLQLTLEDLERVIPGFCGLAVWHRKQLDSVAVDVEKSYANAVWQELSTKQSSEQEKFIERRNAFQEWYSNQEWRLKLDPFAFDIDYTKLLEQETKRKFGVALPATSSLIQICSNYRNVLDQREDIEKSLSNNEKSLLFFPGNEVEVNAFVQKAKDEDVSSKTGVEYTNDVLPLKNTSFVGKAIDRTGIAGNHLKGKNGSVDPKEEKRKRRVGKKAEKQVRDTLVKEFGRANVQWVSGNSDEDKCDDSLGYDFLYRKNEHCKWFYLEVKSVSSNSFIISHNEMSVAFANKQKYHLALVNKEQINIDTSFFTNNELAKDFRRFNSGRSIKPLDYEIFVDIKPTSEN